MTAKSIQIIAQCDERAEQTRQVAYRAAGGRLTETEWNYARRRCEAHIRAAKALHANPTGELILPEVFDLELWRRVRLAEV